MQNLLDYLKYKLIGINNTLLAGSKVAECI